MIVCLSATVLFFPPRVSPQSVPSFLQRWPSQRAQSVFIVKMRSDRRINVQIVKNLFMFFFGEGNEEEGYGQEITCLRTRKRVS